MSTQVRQHEWVRHTQTDVDIIQDPTTGDPVVISTTEQEQIGQATAVFGCKNCDVALTQESANTNCQVPNEKP